MALTYCKRLHFVLNKCNTINPFAVLFQGTGFKNVLSVAHYSDDTENPTKTISNAMKRYLERITVYDQFLKEQLREYNRGKEFLAGMMGKPSKNLTQKEVDEAIEYLFPSALFVPKARPMMKPPEEVYKKEKRAAFDYTGRPFHYLFYTTKPNFTECLHKAASKVEELNKLLYEKKLSPQPMSLVGGRWMSKRELENLLLEAIYDTDYDRFVEVMQFLSKHPLASKADSFINQYWVKEKAILQMDIEEPEVSKDGVKVVHITGSRKKTAIANVKVSYPGTGKIQINNLGIDYFFDIQARHQVSLQ